MKAFIVLLISGLINIALAVVLFQSHAPADVSLSTTAASSPSRGTGLGPKSSLTRTRVVTETLKPVFSWRSIESEDYHRYVANLRRIQCPERTIRDIILADVNKMYQPRLAALRIHEKKFWMDPWLSNHDPEREKKIRQLEKEKDALLKELLGSDWKRDLAESMGYDWGSRVFGFLPVEKQELIRQASEKFDEQRGEIYQKARGYHDLEVQEDLKKIERERFKDYGRFLTPEELEEVKLRSSDKANQLRSQLQTFKPTEEEFRVIFKMESRFDGQAASPQAMTEAQKTLEQTMGSERFVEYKRAQDYEYSNLARLTEKQGLGKDVATRVYDMKSAAEEETRRVRNNPALNPEQRELALQAIRTETERSVAEALGDKGWKNYRRNAWWLRNIAPKK